MQWSPAWGEKEHVQAADLTEAVGRVSEHMLSWRRLLELSGTKQPKSCETLMMSPNV